MKVTSMCTRKRPGESIVCNVPFIIGTSSYFVTNVLDILKDLSIGLNIGVVHQIQVYSREQQQYDSLSHFPSNI